MKSANVFKMVLNSLVPISELNQGKASKIISELKSDDVKIVVKNNEPMAALMSIDRLSELMEAEEKLRSMEKKK
ncbi:MAG: hypothetical protein IIZ11_00270 [Erysipelotrichaceae bacterium]|nr:hypothetical protein [Erysipelotrichaceae bacterium]